MGWHASPSSVTRPRDHCGSGGRSNRAQMNVSSTAPQDLVQLRVPSLEGGDRIRRVAGVGPRLPRPAVLLDDRHEVDQAPALHEVVDEVGVRAHPDLRGHLEVEVAQALGRHQPAVGGAAGEDGVLRPEQHLADGRVDAVGADEEVDLGRRAVREGRLDAVAVVDEAGELVSDVQALGREGAGEGAEQVGAVHLVVGEAEGVDDGIAQVGAQQRASVVPAALVPGQRADAHAVPARRPVPGDAGRATHWG